MTPLSAPRRGRRPSLWGFKLSQVRPSSLLVVMFTMQAAIIVLRMLNMLSTAFMTSDESNYVIRSFYGAPYGFRYFFDYQIISLFRLFSIESYMQFFFFLLIAFFRDSSRAPRSRHLHDWNLLLVQIPQD